MISQKYTYDLGRLNLGNNFRNDHFYIAIGEHDNFEEFYETICNVPSNFDTEITIKAKNNFGDKIEDTFILFELCDLLQCFYDKDLVNNNF